MSLLSRIKSVFGDRVPVPSVKASIPSPYEAGGNVTPRQIAWRVPSAGPSQVTIAAAEPVRNRVRHAVRKDPVAAGIVECLVRNTVSTGIYPRSVAEPNRAKQVMAVWDAFAKRADYCGALSFYGLQQLAARELFTTGEAWARLRHDKERGLTVELLEADCVDEKYNTKVGDNEVRASLERDASGRVVAVHVRPHPGEPNLTRNAMKVERVPVEEILHVWRPERAGQERGISPLAAGLDRLSLLDSTLTTLSIRQEATTKFTAFLRTPQTDMATVPLTGLRPSGETEGGLPIIELEAGTVQHLAPGEEMQFSDPPEPGLDGTEFSKFLLRTVASSLGVPYEALTADYGATNDRLARVIALEARRSYEMWIYETFIPQLCEPVWAAVMKDAQERGELPKGLTVADLGVRFLPQAWAYSHPVQDVEADIKAVSAGFKSRADVVTALGDDVAAVDAQQATDNQRADKLGLSYESDGRKAKSAAPAPPAGKKEL